MVEHYIKELLFDKDYVSVPGLGAFVGSYKEAEISISKNKVSPPCKQIVFNEKFTAYDSILVSYIANAENISTAEAQHKIDLYVESTLNTVNTDSQYVIEGLGRIYKHIDNKIQFEQHLKFNFLNDSFGLPELYFKPIDRTTKDQSPLKNQSLKSMATNNYNAYDDEEEFDETNEFDTEEGEDEHDEEWQDGEKKSQNLAAYYILAVLALVITAGTAYYMSMDKETYAVGSFSPLSWFGNKTDNYVADNDNKLLPEETEEPKTTIEESENNEPNYPEYDDTPTNPKLNKQEIKVPVAYGLDPEDVVDARTGRYYIIAGGFRNKNKAAKYLSELINAGNSAKVISPFDDKGVYRVSLADFATYEEAKQQKENLIGEHGDELWVLGY